MKYYFLLFIFFSFCYKHLIGQDKLTYTHLDSIVTLCMKEHIDFLKKENYLKRGDKLYFKKNDFSTLTFTNWNEVEVIKVDYKEVDALTAGNRVIKLFYIYPKFENNKFLLNVILLSTQRKRKHYTQLNFSTGIFEINYECTKNGYYYKVVKQFQGGEW